MNSIEILAPAGSFETLHAAINAGADAVFFGIDGLNMRNTASANFQIADLKEISIITKESGVKTYLTLNTVLYENEMGLMKEILDAVKEANIDAIIVSDMAAIQYARSIGVEIHISTQVSISNVQTVEFYSSFSDRVVLARELTLDKVKEICTQIKERDIRGPRGKLVEVEVFIHGALCVAVSGRCAMSLYSHNLSANRGECSQMCRRKYKVIDESSGKELILDNNYVMSSADLCTIGMLRELVDTGVSVFKIEGRGRSPEYVDRVTRTYKAALQAIDDGTYSKELVEQWNTQLGTVFNRGLSDGFYMGRQMNEWAKFHGNKASEYKSHVGEVEKYYPKIKVAQVLLQARDITRASKLSINGPKTGVVFVDNPKIFVDAKPCEIASKGSVVTFVTEQKVSAGDKVYVLLERKKIL